MNSILLEKYKSTLKYKQSITYNFNSSKNYLEFYIHKDSNKI